MEKYKSPEWRRSMSVTVDYNAMTSDYLGERGISASDISSMSAEVERAVLGMREKRSAMKWRELPYMDAAIIDRIKSAAERIRGGFESFVVLGIGGSALGPLAVHTAINHLRYNELSREKRGGPRFYVEDNIDPERFESLFDIIDPATTMFNVVTKSGGTSETMSQLLIVTDILKKRLGDGFARNLIATTDEKRGNLIKIAWQLGLETFYIPEGVGGRFSELCPVGLLPAAVCGIDIEELLAGAAYMDALCKNSSIRKNPAYMLGLMQVIAMKKGANISVCMPYPDALKYISDWYAQLWAESLGKRFDTAGQEVFTGQTPVKALGVTDQHSQVQLYMEGPFDKVVTFINVRDYRSRVEIPHQYADLPDVSFLSGHTLNELISAEQFATEYALTKNGRMSNTITLPEINPFTIGQLLFMLEMQTAFAGELLNICTFDQPGVEEGKNATYGLLNKQGYGDKREELAAAKAKNSEYIITGS